MDACVEVENGKIVSVKKAMDGCRSIRGVVLPGGVDIHVHFREPGQSYKEDFGSGTMSSAFGGITTVADMPNNIPPIVTREDYESKLSLVRDRAWVDFALYMKLTERSERVPGAMYKWYMYEAPGIVPPEDLNGTHITVHAELPECAGNSETLESYDVARPARCEVRAVRKLLELGRKFHIAHVSSPDTVDMCRIGGFTCEVTPHHLFLHKGMELGAYGKVNPPLRARWVAERLWDELLSGRIDIVASDHAPHTIEEKSAGFESAPPGLPEVETYLPIFMHMMKEGKISLSRLVRVIMEAPAELLGLKKGRIAVGYDADFAAFTLSDVRKINANRLHYKCGWSPYDGFSGIFPHAVYLRGERIMSDGEMEGEPRGVRVSPA